MQCTSRQYCWESTPPFCFTFVLVVSRADGFSWRVEDDVTAQVTANVTAVMDPEGMGVHMRPSAAPLPLGEDGKEVPAAAPPLAARRSSLTWPQRMRCWVLGVFVDISKVLSNALVTSSKTVHDSAINVIVHQDCATG